MCNSLKRPIFAGLVLAVNLMAGAWTLSATDGPPIITAQPLSRSVLAGNPVTFSVGVDGTAPFAFQWWRNFTLLPGATSSSYTLATVSLPDNGASFVVTVSNTLGNVTSTNAILYVDPGVLVTNSVSLVPINATWKFNEAAMNLGTAWTATNYDDTVSGWSNGVAVFDAKSGTTRTTVTSSNIAVGVHLNLNDSGGVNRIPTYYFRTHFNFNSTNYVGAALHAQAIIDDGVIIYLNGQLATNLGVNVGALYTDWATRTMSDPAYEYFDLPTNYLLHGDNVLAVELHQVNNTSSDITLGLALNVDLTQRVSSNSAPVLTRVFPMPGSTLTELTGIEVLFDKPVLGVDASDLLVNGVPATSLTYGVPGQFVFDFSQPTNGTVQITWAPNHGITDYSWPPTDFAGGGWSYVLDPNSAPTAVVINEFLADNGGKTYRDEDGDASDWIELYNASSIAVNMDGWFLTDKASNPNKWRIPAFTMQPNTYLVIFASGKNRTNVTSRLHTNFQLSKSSGYLGLFNPLLHVVSEFAPTYPQQYTDISYGRDRLNLSLTGYFNTPTPGAANSTSGGGFGPEVVASRSSGTFPLNGPFSVSLSLATNTPNTTIYYSLGTATPDTNSTLYTTPIAIANTTLVRARAFTPGQFPGPIITLSYIALDTQTNILGFNSDLPVIILHNYGAGALNASTKAAQYVIVQTFEPGTNRTSLTNAPTMAEHGAFHIRGSSTAGIAKGAFALETQDEFGDNKNVPFLGFPSENDWVLYAPNNFEPVLMHNPLSHQLYRDTGNYGSRTRFVEVFLKDDTGTPGPITYADYNGIYVLEEKIKIDNNRVNIDKLVPENNTVPAVTGGYLLSEDRSTGEPGLTAGGLSMNYLDPSGFDMTNAARAPQVSYINGYFNNFYSALNSANWTNPITGYAAWIDVDQWINFHIHEVVTFNVDGLRLSGYFYKPRNDTIKMGPTWDYDRTQGSTDGRDFNPYTWRSPVPDYGTDFFNAGSTFSNPWFAKLFTDPDFWQKWIDRYQALRDTVLSTNNIFAHIDDFANQVRQAQPREQTRWGFNPRSGTVSAGGFTYTFAGGYQGEVNWSKDWYTYRLNFMDTNFLSRPTLSVTGGLVAMGSPLTLTPAAETGSTVIYTLNGTDPRLPGGGIASGALTSSGPLTLNVTTNIRVFARSQNPNHYNLTGANNPPISSPWSGPRVSTYYVAIPSLRITELMFNPAPPPSGSPYNNDDFEFVELKNTGAVALNLVGFRFTNGIDFTFTATNWITSLAAGERVLIVKNFAAFATRYPSVTNRVAGEFGGNLNNNGEEIALIGPMLEPILDFTYSDAWYPLADGGGFSLVVVDDTAPPSAWTNAANWRASTYEGGSPAAADPAPFSIFPVLVNEVLSRPVAPALDAIELFNPNTNAVDLSGWYLTDNPNSPKKYRIPDGTVITAGGYLVFDENAFNSLGSPTAFALDSGGDQAYLFSANPTNGALTGFSDGFSFDGALPGVSFGRYINSVGELCIVPFNAITLGTNNAAPLIGPVVINEIMYEPPALGTNDNTRDEFIEIHNASGAPVQLFDPNRPTNTWQITKAVDFSFPTNVVLPSNGYAVVVSFNPAADTNSLSAFKARYGLSNDVSIFGPYNGHLGNTSETIHLKQPLTPDYAFQSEIWFVADQVSYASQPPWACGTAGTGASLQRQRPGDFGNDPLNWSGITATPGHDNTLVTPGVPTITTAPIAQATTYGNSVSFSAAACGTPQNFQWLFNGTNLPAATNATLLITNAQVDNAGPYAVIVWNFAGSITSAPALLTVQAPPPPGITGQPVSRLVAVNAAVSFSVIVTGVPPISFQWRLNGTNLTAAASSTFSLTSAQFSDAGPYSVVVSNPSGSITSAPAVLTVMQPPSFTVQPQSQTVFLSNTATFTVSVSGGSPISLQWTFNGTNLLNATNATLTLSNVQLSQAGSYQVRATNLVGIAFSDPATLIVPVAITITAQPQSTNLWPYSNATFSVSVSGSQPISYQWRWAGTNLPNATNASLTKNSVLPGDAGSYSVFITNTISAVTSTLAVLTVNTNPLITAQPLGRSAMVGSNATFSVVAFSSTPLRYQWFYNTNTTISGATNDTLAYTNVQTSNYGWYNVRVYDSFGSTWSDSAQMADKLKPSITQQPSPTNSVILLGTPFAISSSAIGPPPLSFRWRRSGTTVTNMIQNETNSIYYIPAGPFTNLLAPYSNVNVGFTYAGVYDVVVTNVAGNAPASARASLTIMEPLTNHTARLGSNVTFTFMACSVWTNTISAASALRYQWFFNSTNLLLSRTNLANMTLTLTNITLNLTNVQYSDEGPYTAVVTTSNGIYATQTATLTIQRPPTITDQPTNQSLSVGDTAVFTVGATGVPSPGYQWWFNQTNLLAGATGPTLTLTNAQTLQAGGYSVVVSNSVGAVTSQVAQLTVTFSEPPQLGSVVGPPAPGGLLQFTFGGVAGQSYTVLWREFLDQGNWQPLTNISLLGSSQPVLIQDTTAGQTQRFYRVVMPMRQGDYFKLAASWYTGDPAADLDGNGVVDLDDYFIMVNHWGETDEAE